MASEFTPKTLHQQQSFSLQPSKPFTDKGTDSHFEQHNQEFHVQSYRWDTGKAEVCKCTFIFTALATECCINIWFWWKTMEKKQEQRQFYDNLVRTDQTTTMEETGWLSLVLV